MEAVALGSTDKDLVSSLASRLARLDRRMNKAESAARRAIAAAVGPVRTNSALRQTIAAVQKSHEQVVDIVSKDQVTFSGYSQDAKDKAAAMTKEFEQYLAGHKDEIEALQILHESAARRK